ncbi:regulator of G-protein signaling 9-binding protein B-like isoform X2 [Ruditapes philippinarum]|uniref:regulator of G-protein signaling 9-binding protein B-like isoform X2 n=1 Tax=Ruditapes philippinarum TaxID=129788 RepID=UPI00295A6E7C|nr:regulator of G-protein signaling 9-binding protein B-like isoform X2 [Ruditapes philippinarum]
MSTKFETGQRAPASSNEPQLTAFTGVGDVDRVEITGAGRDECAKILSELNHEAATYCLLSSSLGTKTDGDLLRRKLRLSRIRAWDHAKRAQNKLIPVLRRNLIRSECTEELERMYRAFSACLEFLEQQYLITLLLQLNFDSMKDDQIFINSGLSETPCGKKFTDKLAVDLTNSDVLSIKSMDCNDVRASETDDVLIIQKEMEDLHELIYSMNQSIAIQAWEIDPDMETEKFTIAIENEASVADSLANTENYTEDPDNRKIRCVSIVIVTIMLIIVGGIVGILMGLLD